MRMNDSHESTVYKRFVHVILSTKGSFTFHSPDVSVLGNTEQLIEVDCRSAWIVFDIFTMFPFEEDMGISLSVNGGSSCGKSVFCMNIFKFHKDMFPGQNIENFIICYNEWQDLYTTVREYCPNVRYIHGLISREQLTELTKDRKGFTLILLDDLQSQLVSSELFLEGLISMSHHRRIHFVFTIHNIFHQGKYSRTLSLNTKYITLFINRRDRLQVQKLATQIMGKGGSKAIMEAYDDVQRSQRYGYILIDLSPHSNPKYMLRTSIFPGDVTKVYVIKE